jgi:patatin-like phospholipase/acyl hydrolase
MRVLALSGGGIRGIVECVILKKIVRLSGKKFEELFDYVIGTSAGGMLGAALTVKDNDGKAKYDVSEVLELLKANAGMIFPGNGASIFSFTGVCGSLSETGTRIAESKHSRENLDNFLLDKLGNATFLNTTIPFTTVSYSLEYSHPRIWSTCKAQQDECNYNYFLRDAAGATSAAPTYYPAKHTVYNGKNMYDIDGGIFANTPIHVGMSEIRNCEGMKYTDLKDAIVISIGTGKFPASSFNTANLDLGIYGWMTNGLIEKIMHSSEVTDVITASKLYRLARINPPLDSKFEPMDKVDSQHLSDLITATEQFTDQNLGFLEKIADCLVHKDHSSRATETAHPCQHILHASGLIGDLEFKYEELLTKGV